MMDETQRAEFERFMFQRLGSITRNENGEYTAQYTRAMWAGWQARDEYERARNASHVVMKMSAEKAEELLTLLRTQPMGRVVPLREVEGVPVELLREPVVELGHPEDPFLEAMRHADEKQRREAEPVPERDALARRIHSLEIALEVADEQGRAHSDNVEQLRESHRAAARALREWDTRHEAGQ
jgi:hypothetical protein